MQLNSITLHGFKSFGNRTVISFTAGTTVVVGPNGSGKSNIIEALRWATGGGRASQYRADDKTDLIFHGASGKRGVGYAEVEIELQHGTRKIHVHRNLNRDGSSRLRLNGRNARFLDLDEELSGSGLGRGSLAIIGQGEISSVLTADPASLLKYITEAAGVARLASRREQAKDRLATARDHLERLQDLHDEQQRHLERLKNEAEAATRHQQLSASQLQLRYSLALGRQRALAAELRNLSEQEAALEETIARGATRQAQLQQQHAGQQKTAGERQEEYRQASAAAETWKGELRLAETRESNTREKLDQATRQEEQLQADLAQLKQLQAPTAPDGDARQLERQATEAASSFAGSAVIREELERDLERHQAELHGLMQKFEREQATAAGFRERLAALDLQLTETRDRLQAARKQEQEAERETGSLSGRLAELTSSEAKHEELITRLRADLEEAQQQHAGSSAEAEARSSAAARLRQQLEARQGYAQGPRNALTSGIPGVLGSVADLLTVTPEYREAVSAALGRRTEFIVTDSSHTARKLLAFVRSAGGFVTILPLDLVSAPAPQLSGQVRQAGGVLGLALEHVSFADRFERLFNQLLGSTTLITGMDEALRLAENIANRPRLVTLSGELLESFGAMSGGRRQGQSGILSQKTDVEEAESLAAGLQAAAAQAQLRLVTVQQETRKQLDALQALRSEREEHARRLAARREAAAACAQLNTELESRLASLEKEAAGLQAPASEVSAAAVEAFRQDTAALHARVLAARQQEADARQASSKAAQELAVLQERIHAHAQASARHDADLIRRSELELRLEGVRAGRSEAAAQLEAAVTQLEGIRSRRPVELEGIRQEADRAREQLRELERQLADSTKQQQEAAENLERTRLAAARREAQLELASEELAAFPTGVEPLELTERNCRAQLEAVTTQLEALGPVNHRAASEYREEAERAGQLAHDLRDASLASSELDETLEQVDREVTSRTEAAIKVVRAGFQRHVSELFGETAQADISVEQQDGRPWGLHIQLQPPGKRTRQLNLLSVGERTMGALAFLFALMDDGGNQGLPIAVLDEVDAPLDEANIVRFTRFIERLSASGTQFILVSHQKTTFEAAEVMWGVTSDQGVSKLFSISREEASGDGDTASGEKVPA